MKNKQFTCPVSMAVTEEQFNKDLRQPLEELGYSINVYDYENYRYIVNNPSGNYGRICNYSDNAKNEYSRHFIDHYNPKLFLALASMTNDENGSIGEYWKYIGGGDGSNDFSMGKLYKQIAKNITDFYSVIDDQGDKNGYPTSAKQKFIKATKEEIIAFFTETKEEVLARFEKGVESELIGYRFRNNDFNRMTIKYFSGSNRYTLRGNNTHISVGSDSFRLLNKLNILDIFCEPVYK